MLGRRWCGNTVPARETVDGRVLGVRRSIGIMSKYHFPVSPQAKACNCPLVTITSCINSSKLKLSILLRTVTVRYFVLLQTNMLACCCSQMLAEDRRHLHLRHRPFITRSSSKSISFRLISPRPNSFGVV